MFVTIVNNDSSVVSKGAFTLANFTCDFALSLHILLNKNYLFSLLNVQASAKSRAKLCQCKCTLSDTFARVVIYDCNLFIMQATAAVAKW